MRSLTITLDEEMYRALWEARGVDRVAMNQRVRSLISLWLRQPQLAAAVRQAAAQLSPAPTPAEGQRLTVQLDDTAHSRLLAARAEDRISMTDRVRALISLWQQRPELLDEESPTRT